MTALTFLIVLIAAWVHFVTRGYFIVDGLTIYVAAYVATLAMACVAAGVSRNRHCILGAVVLVAYFVAHHAAWHRDDPILWLAVAHLVVAAWFVLFGNSRWEFTTGLIFVVQVLSCGLTQLGLIPNSAERPDIYIAWSHPDITAILGHMASITLGLGAGDAGARIRVALRSPSLAADYRHSAVAWLARLAKGQRKAQG